MATNRVLQLLRSNQIYANFTAAKTAIEGLTGHKDGEILLARYISSAAGAQTTTYETAIGVYAGSVGSDPETTTVNHWTVFKSSTELDAQIAALQSELDATQAGAGLGTDGSYTAPTSSQDGYDVIGTATSLNDAINKIAKAIEDMDHNNNYTAATTGNDPVAAHATDASKVISGVNQENGVLDTVTTDAVDLLLTGYTNNGSNSGNIAATDTLEDALNKLENATTTGIQVSAMTGNQITRITGDSTAANNGLYSHVELVAITGQDLTALGTNVKEAYKLQSNGADITGSAPIKIYKDSSLKEVYLGADTDTIDASTGTITKNTVTDPQSMNFAYQLADGTYELVKIDVSKFLTESEFGDGLSVSGGVVSVAPGNGIELTGTTPNKLVAVKAYDGITVDANGVSVTTGNGIELTGTSPNKAVAVKIDSTSEQDSQETPADFLTVGADGVKVQGIKDEITRKINALDGEALASTAPTAVSYSGTNNDEFQVLTRVNELNGIVQTVDATANSNGSKSVTLKKVAATGAASDVSYDNSTAQMADSPATVQAAIDKLDSRIDALGTDALESVTSANAGIAVGTKSNHSQELTLTLDDSTTGTGSELTGTNNALTITNDGLFLSNIWDCGTY